jgi:hypothetical protein
VRLPASDQNVRYGDLPDFNPIDHHRNIETGSEINAIRITVQSRSCVHLDLTIDQIDNPVDRDAAPRISCQLLTPISVERRLGDFDQEYVKRYTSGDASGPEGIGCVGVIVDIVDGPPVKPSDQNNHYINLVRSRWRRTA